MLLLWLCASLLPGTHPAYSGAAKLCHVAAASASRGRASGEVTGPMAGQPRTRAISGGSFSA